MAALTQFRAIDVKPHLAAVGSLPDIDLGAMPTLRWIKISELVVDPGYQRDLGVNGQRNITKIARDFDWSKFAPVIVAPIDGKRYAVVDGQHRTTAAALRKIKEVPCQVIVADRGKQAAAFVAINASVTAMSPMQVHAAKLAAGDPEAARLTKLCATAGVTILRYPVQTKNQKVGETMSVGMLYRALTKFGADVLTTALSCITRTRNGYPGLVRGQLFTALCAVLEAEPEWLESRRLLKIMSGLDLAATFAAAGKATAAGSGSNGLTAALVDSIGEHLEREFSKVAA